MVKSGRFTGALSFFFLFISFFIANPPFCVADSSLVTTAPVEPARVLVLPVSEKPVSDKPVPDKPMAVKVELHTEPSESVVSQGEKFLLTFKIIYYGSNSYWHVKSIDGPELNGVVQVSHGVSSIVGRTSEGVVCEEIQMSFSLVLQVGPIVHDFLCKLKTCGNARALLPCKHKTDVCSLVDKC